MNESNISPAQAAPAPAKISFNGVFHDFPSGLQTHIYAAAGVDLRHNYYILGNQPGEMLKARELGSVAPISGLYVKEDKRSSATRRFCRSCRKQLQEARDVLIARLVKKAELVDAGILRAMLEDGKLKITNRNNRKSVNSAASAPDQSSEFPPSSRSSTQPSTFADSQDTGLNQRYSPAQPSGRASARSRLRTIPHLSLSSHRCRSNTQWRDRPRTKKCLPNLLATSCPCKAIVGPKSV